MGLSSTAKGIVNTGNQALGNIGVGAAAIGAAGVSGAINGSSSGNRKGGGTKTGGESNTNKGAPQQSGPVYAPDYKENNAMTAAEGKATNAPATIKQGVTISAKDQVIDDIQKALENADVATTASALKQGRNTVNKYSSMGRAASAQMSSNEDLYKQAKYVEDNLQSNRQTAYDAAITAGQEKLKAAGEETLAKNLEQARGLNLSAEEQQNWANTLSMITNTMKGVASL